MVDYKNFETLIYNEKNYMVIYQNHWSFEQNLKIKNFDLLFMNKLWYRNEKNYGSMPKTMELWFTMEKIWYYKKL